MKKLILFGIVFVLLIMNVNGQLSADGKLIELGPNLEKIPVVGARIEAFEGDFGIIPQIKFSDSRGDFQLIYAGSELPSGGTVIITKDGYYETRIDNFLERDDIRDLDLEILMKRISQEPSSPSQSRTPAYLNRFIEDKDFDKVLVKLTSVDVDLMGNRYDFNRIALVGSVQYYFAPMISKLENNYDFVNVKPNSIIEFWKDNKKVDQKTLAYDTSMILRQNCGYYVFRNKDNLMAHFDVCRSETSSSGQITASQLLSREQVKTGEFASIDGKAVATNLNGCIDSRSVALGIESFIGLVGENWCKDETGFYLNKLCNNGVCNTFDSVASESLCSELKDDNLKNINVDGVNEITGNEVLTDEIDVVGVVEGEEENLIVVDVTKQYIQ